VLRYYATGATEPAFHQRVFDATTLSNVWTTLNEQVAAEPATSKCTITAELRSKKKPVSITRSKN
jgi:hypothetical protein